MTDKFLSCGCMVGNKATFIKSTIYLHDGEGKGYSTQALYCPQHKGFTVIAKVVEKNLVYRLDRSALSYIHQEILNRGLKLPNNSLSAVTL